MKMGYSESYILFLGTLLLGISVVVTSSTWVVAWIGLELNLLSFIPLLLNKFCKEEALVKYFIIQVLAGQIFIFGGIASWIYFQVSVILLLLALSMKLGLAPLHFWYPSVSSGCGWQENLILMVVQKVAPLHLMVYVMDCWYFVYFLILCSGVMGALGGLNQIHIRKLMAYSSINHMGWIMACMLFATGLWMKYFMVYSFISVCLILLFMENQMYRVGDVVRLGGTLSGLGLAVIFLSLGGLPPFLGFIPKWVVLDKMMSLGMFSISFIMVFSSLLTLYFYLRVVWGSLVLVKYSPISYNLSLSWSILFMILVNIVGGVSVMMF